MRPDVEFDMSWSSVLFEKQVWPIIKESLGGGDLLQMENRPDIELAKILDMKAGIDGWHIKGDLMRGIACRCQDRIDYRSFTIRKSRASGARTEYEKRREAITSPGGFLFPAITVQSYAKTTQGPVLSIGIAFTKDVIEYIDKGLAHVKPVSNAEFWVVDWFKFRQQGYLLKTIDHIYKKEPTPFGDVVTTVNLIHDCSDTNTILQARHAATLAA